MHENWNFVENKIIYFCAVERDDRDNKKISNKIRGSEKL